MSLVDRHLAFVQALRSAGLPVSLSEGLDAARAIGTLGLTEREALRAAYAATLVKRQPHRPPFDQVFDLYFPKLVGEGTGAHDGIVPDVWVRDGGPDEPKRQGLSGPDAGPDAGPQDGPEQVAAFREQLAEAMAVGDPEVLEAMAREAVRRFGQIRGRSEGQQRWSSYNVLNRLDPGALVGRVLRGLLADTGDDPALLRLVEAQARVFEELVDSEVRRRAAEVRGPEHIARTTVRRSVEQLDFTSARRSDLEALRREIEPLARRLATRLHRTRASRRRGPLDFRRTVRASLSSGGVPLETHHRPRRPGRPDLVVLCDVSGSVANFASFTLMLVFALREQFSRVRAFTFVDDVHEVTDRFGTSGDPAEVLEGLAASAAHATLWGRTNYGRALRRFLEEHADALTPRTDLLVLGDARSNYADPDVAVLREIVGRVRHAWWLNPEHPRHWDTGDSAAGTYAAVLPMVECRNLVQLGEFVRDLR
ncbi:MAG TPA: VWA domain-containing protein [Marmoricola sp.]|jgi:uncharacterized protein with von Willebrand factor type A (vWA) domain|nr:VWA domain-containing protein [Marmoricola sp.]